MLRNGTRALSISPSLLGPYLWLGVLDQRFSMWTALISPSLLIVALIHRDFYVVTILVVWILLSRSVYVLSLYFSYRLCPLNVAQVPILLASQWSNALVKIFTLMFLNKQKWTNRHKSKTDKGSLLKSKSELITLSKGIFARMILILQAAIFFLFILYLYGSINYLDFILFT